MNEALCKEKHKQIAETLEMHNNRLNAHAKQLDILSEDSREYKVQIQNLCKQIEDLTKTIKWAIGVAGTSFVGFFFYAAQKLI
ncbi:hemolysin XhlA family protein [Marinisporobacter balticus]|uniref:Hemolysin XhlA n=1 Tax=Marinisporobacter balticus TaxID=2018667 RepID=A0A4R2KHL1_9FIRM|nr:hemolysin XhlA family protein [Marinisporobacter balticus]TCO69488.1 hemolysin XhlA [Marinisporobacter balticus]